MARISPLDLESILLHELAHVSRHDQLVNLLQRLTKSVLFFHPVVWLLSREMRLQREHCCDAWVIGQTGRDVDYARCLAELARRLVAARTTIPGLAMAELRHELSRRVAAVLNGSARTARVLPRWAHGAILAVAFSTATVVGTCGLTARAQAQGPGRGAGGQTLAEMNAAMNMNDTLTGTGTVSPMNPGARGLPVSQMPNAPAPPFYMNHGSLDRASAADGTLALADPSASLAGKILVLAGERVTCPVTGVLLEDVHYEYRPESAKGEYYDDGTHGDLVANDNIWTNYAIRDDVLSPEGNHLKQRYLRMLKLVEKTNPVDFFGGRPATSDPGSKLPQLDDEENDRDEQYIRRWHEKFLAAYRQDSEDPASDFYPIFVPNPPRAPHSPQPPEENFSPTAFALDAFIQSTVQGATAPLRQPSEQRPGGRITIRD